MGVRVRKRFKQNWQFTHFRCVIYIGESTGKHKTQVFGTKIHSYELVCHPYIDEDPTKIVFHMNEC